VDADLDTLVTALTCRSMTFEGPSGCLASAGGHRTPDQRCRTGDTGSRTSASRFHQ
jgi:hypothetical protein